jgi:EAL domain-containing protein (putative c-di-GMP-specific phosphodiesterase class I)
LEELEDIYRRHDLRDPRVLAYCQPVYNIQTGKYDTAEALMRLKLSDIGMVFPDQFIPVAEEHGYIHVLTEIILQKTCDEIRYLVSEGYEVNRISINVSVLELRDDTFTVDIDKIIKESGIPEEKVAIEITESQSESDFIVMKHIIDELKEKGIKFYLDDFGTGYSNMERIMELPFDIIKFDRSLVLASDSDERSEKMVGSLASMFKELDFSVLYEGVENESDEKRCINMSASYLQGYKYSRPIPMIELTRFFSKINAD